MASIPIEGAQARLREVIRSLTPGEELVITDGDRPIARVVATDALDKPPRQPGTMKGTVIYMGPDFDAPLEEFEEYME